MTAEEVEAMWAAWVDSNAGKSNEELLAQMGCTEGGTVHLSRHGFVIEPPPGLDPTTLRDDQLGCYGFPRRPRERTPEALAAWAGRARRVDYRVTMELMDNARVGRRGRGFQPYPDPPPPET